MKNLTKNEKLLKSVMEENSSWDYHTTPFFDSADDKYCNSRRGWWTRNARLGYELVFLGENISSATETIIERNEY